VTSTVPPGRGASLHRYPGTSCLATISLSLRDKSHSPIEGLGIKLALMQGALRVNDRRVREPDLSLVFCSLSDAPDGEGFIFTYSVTVS
jgi:hypothetical protein